jgi:UTP-glucose-1-phosphate uridylyltransferase
MGEITTPSRCGRMDQGCAFGNHPVLMTFDGDRMDTETLTVASELYFVIVDLQSKKDTMEILNRLNRSYPIADNKIERGVHELLGPVNKRIVSEAAAALRQGNAKRLGELMTEAQAMFDKYALPACPEELTAPVLHKTLAYPKFAPHIWGGKGVGSQGDGTAQFMARSEADQQAIIEILEKDLHLAGLALTMRPTQRIRRAVIPAAGFGTRLFPASKATKKELFPVVDRDGIAKPAILYIVQEALDAGIEEIVIIVQPDDLDEFQSFFNDPVSVENFNKLPRHFQEFASRILDIGKRVTFVTQKAQEGFGHAIYCAREAVGGEPFLLMLGDHLYRAKGEKSCAAQLVDAYNRYGTNILGLRSTPEDQIANFGTVGGVWVEENRLLNISEFAEKPTADYARNNLRAPGMEDGQYLTVFGLYIIKPRIFEILEENIQNNVRERGEFQLTSALDRLRREDGFHGLIMDGTRFDIGLPDSYLESLALFRKE